MTDDGIFTYQQIGIASNFLMKLAFQNVYKEYHDQKLKKKLFQKNVCSSMIYYSYSREHLA